MQISMRISLTVARVVKLFPQPQVMVHSMYLGWILSFMVLPEGF